MHDFASSARACNWSGVYLLLGNSWFGDAISLAFRHGRHLELPPFCLSFETDVAFRSRVRTYISLRGLCWCVRDTATTVYALLKKGHPHPHPAETTSRSIDHQVVVLILITDMYTASLLVRTYVHHWGPWISSASIVRRSLAIRKERQTVP